jgi:hypothetical protein
MSWTMPRPDRIALYAALALIGLGLIWVVIKGRREWNLVHKGVPAKGTILEIRAVPLKSGRTGALVEALLEVRLDGEAPYQGKARFFLAYLRVPQYQPGTVIDVRVDPQDHSRIGVEDVMGED